MITTQSRAAIASLAASSGCAADRSKALAILFTTPSPARFHDGAPKDGAFAAEACAALMQARQAAVDAGVDASRVFVVDCATIERGEPLRIQTDSQARAFARFVSGFGSAAAERDEPFCARSAAEGLARSGLLGELSLGALILAPAPGRPFSAEPASIPGQPALFAPLERELAQSAQASAAALGFADAVALVGPQG